METAGQIVDFHRCEVAAGCLPLLAPAAHYIVFHPAEHPEGIPFGPWLNEVMRQ
jgi:hypothetical protein